MREDLKGQNLTFTEIAKLVGEHWQGLPQAEKEPYERQAQAAKEKYNQDLAEYKKTPEYKRYTQYLQDFKAKHAANTQGEITRRPTNPTRRLTYLLVPDKDGSKRVRLSDPGASEANGVSNSAARNGRAGSTGDYTGEPPARRQRIGSTVSNGEPYYAMSVLSASQQTPGDESNVASPATGYFEKRRDHSPTFALSPRDSPAQPTCHTLRRDPIHIDGIRGEQVAPSRQLPPLSDVIDGRPLPNGTSLLGSEAPTPTFGLLHRAHQTGSPAPTSSIASSDTRPPSLRKEQSSAGSMSSGSSYSSYPRTPTEGPLPIHALLTNGKQFGPYDSSYGLNPTIHRSLSPDERVAPAHYPPERAPSDPTTVGHHLPPVNGQFNLFFAVIKTGMFV